MRLRDYQGEAVQSIYDYFDKKSGNPLVVLPTGAGKSIIIGYFVRDVISRWPGQRIMVLTHVKELIEQNYEKLITFWPQAPAGIYSASLNSRDTQQAIIFGGIQSIHSRAHEFGHIDLVIIDECHLVPTKRQGMYRKFLDALMKINPALKVIGTTATHYRLDSGLLTDGDTRIFTDVAYNLPVKRLIDDGYLSPVRTPAVQNPIDISNVKISMGEFKSSDMDKAVHLPEWTAKALTEICAHGSRRRSWLIFCTSVEYAEEIRDELIKRGIASKCVTGKTPSYERDKMLSDFKSGKIKALTNCNVLTTGIDAPATDMLAILSSTNSISRYVQIVGRGMRISPETGKKDCLVLDFGGNVERHGPVDSIVVKSKRPKGEGGVSTVPTKMCPECREILSVFARECNGCGYVFPAGAQHGGAASNAAILSEEIKPEWFDVSDVHLSRHYKKGKPTTLKVNYRCGVRFFPEWVCIEHMGWAQAQAVKWWKKRSDSMIPTTVDAAIDFIENRSSLFRRPARISVKKTGKYYEVVDYEFDETRLVGDQDGRGNDIDREKHHTRQNLSQL